MVGRGIAKVGIYIISILLANSNAGQVASSKIRAFFKAPNSDPKITSIKSRFAWATMGNTKGDLVQNGVGLNDLKDFEVNAINDIRSMGRNVELNPTSDTDGIKAADFYIDGVLTELKTRTVSNYNQNQHIRTIREAYSQSQDYVITDLRITNVTDAEIQTLFNRLDGSSVSIPETVEIWTKTNVYYYNKNG